MGHILTLSRRFKSVVVVIAVAMLAFSFSSTSQAVSVSGKLSINSVSVGSVLTTPEFGKAPQLKSGSDAIPQGSDDFTLVTQQTITVCSWFLRAAVLVRHPIYVFTSIHAP